jgi:DNA-binding GntR family transcriptional regulator
MAPPPRRSHVHVDAAVVRLERAILSGELRSGTRLSEHALAKLCGVGRGPLREAVRTLEGRRLVERVPFSGVRVTQLSIEDFQQLLVAREALEGIACRQAAECMTLAETRELRHCLTTFSKRIKKNGIGSVYVDGTQDNDFHVQIVRGSRNKWLEQLLCRDLYALLRMYRYHSATVGDRAVKSMQEHETIFSAIEKRDPDEAERLMRLHIAHSRDNLIAQMKKDLAAANAAGDAARVRRTKRRV